MLRRALAIFVALALVGCGEAELDEPTGQSADRESADKPATAEETANTSTTQQDLQSQDTSSESFTFRADYIEVDRLEGGTSSDFGDANLYPFSGTDTELSNCSPPNGSDPADGTCDARLPESQLPACTSTSDPGPCTCTGDSSIDPDGCIPVDFADWNEILTDDESQPDPNRLDTHRFLDEVKRDSDSFKSDSCVTETNVLAKMDVTAGAVTNNTEYAYLALKRHDNNGDAGYTWLFTQIRPELDPTFASCPQGDPLVYTLSEGDTLVSGNFNPSAGAELTVRRATANADGVRLVAAEAADANASNSAGPLWEEVPGTENLAAVNTTDTDIGVLEVIDGVDKAGDRTDKGAISGTAGDYDVAEHIFAEAAVDIDTFTGGEQLCGQKFYGSVITRPSTTNTSDLKDLVAPRLYNFGALTVEASVAPSCDKQIEYDVGRVSGPGFETSDPDADDSVSCHWTFTHTTGATETASDCSGTLQLDASAPTGDWTAAVEVTLDNGLSCTESKTVGTVPVFEPLTVDKADLSPTCSLAFGFDGSYSGGSADATVEWSFSGPGTVTPSTTDSASGTATVDTEGNYSGEFTVTDPRTDSLTCTASSSDVVAAFKELGTEVTTEPFCDSTFDYSASFTGGSGAVDYAWTFSGPDTVSPSTTTDPSGTASVGTADEDYTASVVVTDERTDIECTASDSSTVHPLAPIEVEITPNAESRTCSAATFTDAINYQATVSGGDGNYSFDWTGCTSSSGDVCSVNPDDSVFCASQSVFVEVDDSSAICAATDSETETYSKVTTVSATDN